MKMIDWNKPIQTRDGDKVNIYTTKGMNERFPVVGEVMTKLGYPEARIWASNGKCQLAEFEHDDDIINVPERVTMSGYIVITKNDVQYMFYTEHEIWATWNRKDIKAIIDIKELLPDGIEMGRGL